MNDRIIKTLVEDLPVRPPKIAVGQVSRVKVHAKAMEMTSVRLTWYIDKMRFLTEKRSGSLAGRNKCLNVVRAALSQPSPN